MSKDAVLAALDIGKDAAISMAEIAERTSLTAKQVSSALTNLFKAGAAIKHPGETANSSTYSRSIEAPAAPVTGKGTNKPAATSYKKLAEKVRAAPLEFHCGLTADRSLIIFDPALMRVSKFNPEQTAELADLVFAHFDQG